jgi:hypothetical protein
MGQSEVLKAEAPLVIARRRGKRIQGLFDITVARDNKLGKSVLQTKFIKTLKTCGKFYKAEHSPGAVGVLPALPDIREGTCVVDCLWLVRGLF